jgi:hypothetical protein
MRRRNPINIHVKPHTTPELACKRHAIPTVLFPPVQCCCRAFKMKWVLGSIHRSELFNPPKDKRY